MGQVPAVIPKRTVFILGAGASADFGFPLGLELLQSVVDGIQRKQASVYDILAPCGFSGKEMQDFASELDGSGQLSVDAFLENRSEFLEVGKAAIAAVLIRCEDENKLKRRPKGLHWYEYLLNQLGETRPEFEQSKLSIITFNYDRSLEYFLFTRLKTRFKLSDDECKALLRVVPIVHVYGQLGALDYISPEGRRYYPDLDPQTVKKCAKEIKIGHEGLQEDPQFRQAHDCLRHAEVVCFLGFRYHKHNVERLRLNLLPRECYVYGCVYGMKGGEVQTARAMLVHYDFFSFGQQRLYFGNEYQNVLEFLRSQPVFQ